MRTQQQLGYIVNASASADNGQHYLFFIIQSESHPADKVRKKADQFIRSLPAEFEALSDEEFMRFKDVVRAELLEKPKTINEKRGIFYALTFVYDKDFDRIQTNLDALDSLTKSQVVQILSEAINEQTRKVVDVLLFAKQHNMMETTVPTIHDIDDFKAGREFVPRP
jgi:protease-3